jgi:TonB family protein
MVKVTIYLIAFYLVYSLMLKKDTTHGRNRAFIIFSVISALLLPLITFKTINTPDIRIFGRLFTEVFISAGSSGLKQTGNELTSAGIFQIASTIYITGVIIFIIKLIFDLGNLLWLIARERRSGSHIIHFHNFNTSGFSAMGYIFINDRLNPEEAGAIIKHEKNHLRQNHYLDIIFFEVVSAFQWFNPVIYLFNRELRAIHEFQADLECLRSGIPVANYQSLLLSQVFKSGALKLSNSFSNPSLLRKRMIMMTKKRTSQFASLKLLLVIPVAGLIFLSISAKPDVVPSVTPSDTSSTSVNQETIDEVPFVTVEEMPVFPGGDNALLRFIAENTTYPEVAKQNNIQGRIIVKFCISSTGGISQISIVQGVSPELDAEAIRVVKALPPFNPGKQGGKPVPVWYMVPITFTLQ